MADLGMALPDFLQRGSLPEVVDPSAHLAVPYIEVLFSRLAELGEDAFDAGSEAFEALKACQNGSREWIVARIERVTASGADHLRLCFDISEELRHLAAALGAEDFEGFVSRHSSSPLREVADNTIADEPAADLRKPADGDVVCLDMDDFIKDILAGGHRLSDAEAAQIGRNNRRLKLVLDIRERLHQFVSPEDAKRAFHAAARTLGCETRDILSDWLNRPTDIHREIFPTIQSHAKTKDEGLDGPLDQISPDEIGSVAIFPPISNSPTRRGWTVRVYRRGEIIPDEVYAPGTRQSALAVAACLLAGVKVPPLYWELSEVPHAAR